MPKGQHTYLKARKQMEEQNAIRGAAQTQEENDRQVKEAIKKTHEPAVNRSSKKDKKRRRKSLNNQYMTY